MKSRDPRRRRGGLQAEERPYQRIRAAIASGTLMPNERLVEADMAKRLGVPRAAVRTAIVRLAQDQLVERLPNRGARVRKISEREALELLEVRTVLECLAASHAAKNATDGDIRTLHGHIADMERALNRTEMEYTATNARLHGEIVRISGHTTAARLLEGIRARNAFFNFRTVLNPESPRTRLKQHREIVDAIACRDPDGAAAAMHEHLHDVAIRMRARLESGSEEGV